MDTVGYDNVRMISAPVLLKVLVVLVTFWWKQSSGVIAGT